MSNPHAEHLPQNVFTIDYRLPTIGFRGQMRSHPAIVALLIAATAPALRAQSEYYNLDALRPLRVEDALATARYGLDLQLAPLRLEQYGGGLRRWRTEPKLSLGVLPFTELELRAPVVYVQPRAAGIRSSAGVASLGISALRELNLETTYVPALALSGEYVAPVGSLAAPVGSYSVKALATKSSSAGRVHVNAAYGTWSIRTSAPAPATDSVCAGLHLYDLLPPAMSQRRRTDRTGHAVQPGAGACARRRRGRRRQTATEHRPRGAGRHRARHAGAARDRVALDGGDRRRPPVRAHVHARRRRRLRRAFHRLV